MPISTRLVDNGLVGERYFESAEATVWLPRSAVTHPRPKQQSAVVAAGGPDRAVRRVGIPVVEPQPEVTPRSTAFSSRPRANSATARSFFRSTSFGGSAVR